LLVVNPDKNLHIVDETAANQENQNQKQRPETQLSATGNLQANKRAKISGDVARKPLYFKAGQTGRWTWLGMTQEPTRYYVNLRKFCFVGDVKQGPFYTTSMEGYVKKCK